MTHDLTDRLGSVVRDDEGVRLRYERRLAHPPEKVWRALTESEHLRHWFPADILGERREGASLTIRFWPESVEAAGDAIASMGVDLADPALPGELLTWQPPRLLELTWDTDRLRYELEPDGDGTRLRFTTWPGDQSPPALTGAAAGYHACLDALGELLDTGSTRTPVAATEVSDLEERYAALVANGG
ncbi:MULTISPECIES: SRPBCC domain-containing protein [unclassified Nocardioides]|uniref:SRPBCC domain-containing protein n=1 Tax=unclassified Nocardioides TaxID=2615069 RepID=UPI00361D7FEF